MFPIEIDIPTWRRKRFDEDENVRGLNFSSDLLEEVIEI